MKLTWNNIGLKIISVLVAFGIWLMVVNTDDPEKTQPFNVTVTIENKEKLDEAGKVYRVIDNTDEVTIWVTARKSVIQSLRASDFKAIADFENLNEAVGAIPIIVECSNGKITQDKIKILPPSLKIELENKKEQEFVLNVEKTGKPAKGYEIASMEAVQGKKIYVAGAESLLKIIGKVSVPVSVQGYSSDRTVASSIKITDKNGAPFTETQMNSLELKTMEGAVISEGKVDVDVKLWRIKNGVPIKIIPKSTPADGYHITEISTTPETLNIAGSEKALEDMGSSLKIEDIVSVEGITEDMETEIDITEILQEKKLKLESGTESFITVKVKIEKWGDSTVAFPVSQLNIISYPKNKNLVFTPADQLMIGVRSTGKNDALTSMLTADQIKASVDLTDYQDAGTYSVPVEVELPDGYELVSPVMIYVNVEETNSDK